MEHTRESSTPNICFKNNILIILFLCIFFLLKQQRGLITLIDLWICLSNVQRDEKFKGVGQTCQQERTSVLLSAVQL